MTKNDLYSFSIIIDVDPPTIDGLMDITDAVGDIGCFDATVCGYAGGIELAFDRESESFRDAVDSVIDDVKQAGYPILRLELEPQEEVILKSA